MATGKSNRTFTVPQLIGGINPDSFYGTKKYRPSIQHPANAIIPLPYSKKFNRLFSPSTTWKIFKKQEDLIQFISRHNCDLMPFTFQTENGHRLFLAAHPVTFWYYDEQRNMNDRNTYEIIREFEASKLYFDLEFDKTVNPHHNGHRMVENFIELVCSSLKHKYDIECTANDVLILDSSTNTKFSCHLIFQLKRHYFQDNYNVGFFVKQLCFEIRSLIKGSNENEFLLLSDTTSPTFGMKELEVTDSKGITKLFCDEAVYTKNRHFRLYKSSKFGKKAPLLVSENNKFSLQNDELNDENLFLQSLITWMTDKKSRDSLEFPPNKLHYALKIRTKKFNTKDEAIENNQRSPFPEIDLCIIKIVEPGKIYRTVFFKERGTIVYDIIGNRYCLNIGRPHKSNNVKYVVDLHNLTYYQKCYDPDCAEFKSPKKELPINEYFFLNNDIDDDFLVSAEDQCQPIIKQLNIEELFSTDISDEDFYQIAKQCESHHKSELSSEDTLFNEAYDQEMISVLNSYEQCVSSHEPKNDLQLTTFSDEVSEKDMIDVANRCEFSSLNSSNPKKSKTEEVFFSNDNGIDDSIISAVEKCESTYFSTKQ